MLLTETPTKDKPSSVHDVIESVVNAARKVPKDDTSKDSSGSEAAIRKFSNNNNSTSYVI